jgi:hypothetical protein
MSFLRESLSRYYAGNIARTDTKINIRNILNRIFYEGGVSFHGLQQGTVESDAQGQAAREAGKRQQSAPEPEQGDPLTELNRTLAMLITELKNVQVRMADIAEAIRQSAAMKADRC